MQLSQLYKDLKTKFSSTMENSDLEAKRLIEGVTGLQSFDFITQPEKLIPQDQLKLVDEYASRRLAGEPLSKILGIKEFWGLEFIVNEHVLDPRPDTETLIETVLKWVGARKSEPLKILDLGTGTGCIPITLLTELPNAVAVAVDISEEALNIARQNADKHNLSNRITFVQGNWFDGLEGQYFDIITSNPPYIPNPDIESLSLEVKNHDPILALAGGDSGLECYKIIISSLKIFLNGENKAFLEIGFGQLESLSRLVDDSNLFLCDSKADLAGIPRVVEISCGDK